MCTYNAKTIASIIYLGLVISVLIFQYPRQPQAHLWLGTDKLRSWCSVLPMQFEQAMSIINFKPNHGKKNANMPGSMFFQ